MIDPAQVFSLSVRPTTEGYEAGWTVPADLPYFEGHFPGQPILPGVAILDATVQCLRHALGDEKRDLRSVVSAKFLAVIEPGQMVRITLLKLEGEEWLAKWSADDPSGRRLAELRLGL